MAWPPNVEQWRQWATWEARDIPVDLVLAIVSHESGGIAGIKAGARTKVCLPIPTEAGGTVEMCHAQGLMQVIPALVDQWNRTKEPKATYEDLTGKDERAARMQLRIGCWYFASCVRHLHKYDPQVFPGSSPGQASPDQLELALIAYAVGWGGASTTRGLKPKLDQLRAAGRPLTVAELGAAFPTWGQTQSGKWINRPVRFASTTWGNYQTHTTAPGSPATRVAQAPLPTGAASPEKTKKKEFLGSFGPIIMILGAALISRQGGLLGSIFGNDKDAGAGDAGDVGADEEEEDEDDQYNRGYKDGFKEGQAAAKE